MESRAPDVVAGVVKVAAPVEVETVAEPPPPPPQQAKARTQHKTTALQALGRFQAWQNNAAMGYLSTLGDVIVGVRLKSFGCVYFL